MAQKRRHNQPTGGRFSVSLQLKDLGALECPRADLPLFPEALEL
jgi:hypothetical protein